MVPNFALSLSSDGITLLRRAVTGWSPAGDVALDSADLDAELTALRATAEQLSPGGAQVLLILRNARGQCSLTPMWSESGRPWPGPPILRHIGAPLPWANAA